MIGVLGWFGMISEGNAQSATDTASTYRFYQRFYERGEKALTRADQHFRDKEFQKARSSYDTASVNFEAALAEKRIPFKNDVREKIDFIKKQIQLSFSEIATTRDITDISNRIIYFAEAAIENLQYREALLMTFKAWQTIPDDQNSSTQSLKFRNAAYHFTKKQITDSNSDGNPIDMVDMAIVSPAEHLLAAVQDYNQILFYDYGKESKIVVPSGHDYILDIAFSADGRLATVGKDGKCKLWSDDGNFLFEQKAHNAPILDVHFSPDSSRLVTASRDGTVKLWSITPGGLQRLETLNGHEGPVQEVFFSEDSNWLFSRSSDGTSKVWQLRPKVIPVHAYQLSGGNYIHDLEFSPDNFILSLAGIGRDISLRDIRRQEKGVTIPFDTLGVHSVQLFDSGSSVLAVGLSNKFGIFDTADPKAKPVEYRLTGQVSTAVVGPNDQELIFGFHEGKVELTDLDGKLLMLIQAKNRRNGVKQILFSPDNTYIFILYYDGTLMQCRHPRFVQEEIEKGQSIFPLSASERKGLGVEGLFEELDQIEKAER